MREKGKLGEALRFVLTGGVCFLVEFFCLVLLRDKLGLDTLAAVPLAFLISVVLNYILCVIWVFKGAKDQGNAAKLAFLITSVMGLLLNDPTLYNRLNETMHSAEQVLNDMREHPRLYLNVSVFGRKDK